MLTETRDRDAIVSNAIAIASVEVRAAYIAGACGDDVAMRRQVEELVAAHFHAGSAELSAAAAAPGPRHHDLQRHLDNDTVEAKKMGQKQPRGLVTLGVLLVLVASAAGTGAGLTVWKAKEGPLQKEKEQAELERSKAQKAAEEAKQQREQALVEQQTATRLRDEELAREREAQNSAEDSKAVLAFLQNNLLSAAHKKVWGSDVPNEHDQPHKPQAVTLRQAVDAAEARVATAYPERQLVEASIREILGSAYLDMGEAPLAVKQYKRALFLREGVQGPEHPDTVNCRTKLAVAYRQAGMHEKASALFDQDLESPSYAAELAIQGSMLLAEKKYADAELRLHECLNIRQKTQPEDWTTYDTKAMLGAALLAQKKYEEAEKLLKGGYEGMKERRSKIPSQDKTRLTRALSSLVHLYESWGKQDEAAKWRKELQTATTAKRS